MSRRVTEDYEHIGKKRELSPQQKRDKSVVGRPKSLTTMRSGPPRAIRQKLSANAAAGALAIGKPAWHIGRCLCGVQLSAKAMRGYWFWGL